MVLFSFFDRLRGFFGMEDEQLDADREESLEMEGYVSSGSGDNYSDSDSRYNGRRKKAGKKPRLVGLPTVRKSEILVFEPLSITSAEDIAGHIKLRKTVIVNVCRAEKELIRRIIDFLSGNSYAVDGQVKKIADNIFVFAPKEVEITTPHDQEPESKEESAFMQ